ncbi:hypothetical protein Kuja_0560 [Vibrio phage vB_VchM_Kuja]|uniref:Uncharacterized protein n=1 Tax=Vibrio phage vB_VchM_Kuja TaxID=2686437 RepID=A0A6B9JHQ7_9CAUD|nr:hypothetical protein HWC83_gp180 [Vibrio phage vB_VchM_Kuja]QGZ16047.1 hypothetical protein Kuja_0560 [Vibrio phage vB_VchM_Kuja]
MDIRKNFCQQVAEKYKETFKGSEEPLIEMKNGDYYVYFSSSFLVVKENNGVVEGYFSANITGHPIMVLHELQMVLLGFDNVYLTHCHVVDPIEGSVTVGNNESLEALDRLRRNEAKALIEEMVQEGMNEKDIKQVTTPQLVGLDGQALNKGDEPKIIALK